MPEPEVKSQREPRALSSEYHKARKQLMLWAGILFIWELVGIDLEKAKETGGNAGAIITAIKSPQAVPWALLILVAYFLFKVTVEWYQCSAARRRLRASRIDFSSAWIVSFVAYTLYVGQTISRVQVADVLQSSNRYKSLVIGFALSSLTIVGTSLFYFWKANSGRQTLLRLRLFFLLGALVATLLLPLSALGEKFPGGINWKFGFIGMMSGLIAMITLLRVLSAKVTGSSTG